MALSAIVADIRMGQDVGNRFTAVIQRGQFAGAKGAPARQVDANGQTNPQNEGGNQGYR